MAKRAAPGDPLTKQELEVLKHLCEGLSNKRIADNLQLSAHTVKFHLDNAMRKLSAENRTHAAVKFIRGNYVTN